MRDALSTSMIVRCRTAKPATCVMCDSAADGYSNQRAKSRRTFQGDCTYTGDTYTRDAEGYFRFQGW